MKKSHFGGIAVAITLVGVVFTLLMGANQEPPPTDSLPVRLLNKDIEMRLAALEKASEALRAEMSDLRDFQPVGMIVAFAGTEAPRNWKICNGEALRRDEYPELCRMLGEGYGNSPDVDHFLIPDLRGMFLRGLGGTDPEANRTIGSTQEYATARPRNPFGTNDPGNHDHSVADTGQDRVNDPTNIAAGVGGVWDRIGRVTTTGRYSTNGGHMDSNPGPAGSIEPDLMHAVPMAMAGAHSHAIVTGGDAETRPVNIAVNFIIRVK